MKRLALYRYSERNFQGAKADDQFGSGRLLSFYCVLDEAGQVILEQKLPTTPEAMKQTLGKIRGVSSHWRQEHIPPGSAAAH